VTKPDLVYHNWRVQPHIMHTPQKTHWMHLQTHIVERPTFNVSQASSLKMTWIVFYEATLGQLERHISRPLARGSRHISSSTVSQPATWSRV
jgi:hypothetical protein